MSKTLSLVLLLACSCGSDSSGAPRNAAIDGGNGACPDISGSWTIAQSCYMAEVGTTITVTQQGCSVTFAGRPPGDISADGRVWLGAGSSTCTGNGVWEHPFPDLRTGLRVHTDAMNERRRSDPPVDEAVRALKRAPHSAGRQTLDELLAFFAEARRQGGSGHVPEP